MRRPRGTLQQFVRAGLRRVFGRAILSEMPPSRGAKVCLTFDDGPHPQNTERVLRLLDAADVRATFFVVGEGCERHPDIVRRVLAAGHEVANHGYSHLSPQEVSTSRYVADVEAGQLALERAVGCEMPRTFRPPYGQITPMTFLRLWWRGYRFVLWTVDSNDSYVNDAEEVVNNVVDAPVGNGAIILLHEDYEWTVEAITRLVSHVRSCGLTFTTLSTMPELPPPGPERREERCA